MSYQPLIFPTDLPEPISWMVREQLEPMLRDVHCMARLPLPSIGLEAGCNFAMANCLFTVLSGVSATLYEQDGGARELFCRMMNERYWPIDPPKGIDPERASDLLYDEFRNPFTHALGLAIEFDRSMKETTPS